MGLLKEFKEFAMKGNVVDMAVGIIIGGAFGKIVTSLVNDVVMPVVGALTGGGSFGGRFLWLGEGDKPASLDLAQKSGEPYIGWGPFVQTTLDFMIVAAVIFLMIKAMNRLRDAVEGAPGAEASEPPAPPEPSEDIRLLREIRDALQKG